MLATTSFRVWPFNISVTREAGVPTVSDFSLRSRISDLAMSLLNWSRRVARRIEEAVKASYCMELIYRDAILGSLKSGSLVLDAGAGNRCVYASHSLRVIGTDVLITDLRNNRDIESAVVSDLEVDFPFHSYSIDAVTTCYFVEHIHDTERFIRNVARILKPGGKLFMLFPCRYAPFAVINRLIPNRLAIKMLHQFVEGSRGGFPATYNNCWPKRMREILGRNGLRVVQTKLCFYQSHYYASFLPIYLFSLAYDMLLQRLKIESMAASAFIFAEKAAISDD
jgi:SAM-dependent methyltransferase